eukprot:scaffold44925_cov78-Cyclotella_meneghiniana.AAC.3
MAFLGENDESKPRMKRRRKLEKEMEALMEARGKIRNNNEHKSVPSCQRALRTMLEVEGSSTQVLFSAPETDRPNGLLWRYRCRDSSTAMLLLTQLLRLEARIFDRRWPWLKCQVYGRWGEEQ